MEVKEIKDRLNDAIMATRCALEEGVVLGGGVALLYASKVLEGVQMENFDQQHGLKIIKKALQAPCRRIVDNAGYEGSVVVEHLLNQPNKSLGYNAYDNTY